MVRRICGRPSWLFTVALIASLIAAVPAFAQSTGMVKGVVMDDKNQPANKPQLSSKITLFTDRCIMCTRCVRFTRGQWRGLPALSSVRSGPQPLKNGRRTAMTPLPHGPPRMICHR